MTNGEKYKAAQERAKAFSEWWKSKGAFHALISNYIEEAFAWLDLEAEVEKPLPCPFCKHPQVRVYADANKKRVYCPECGFSMPWRGLGEDVYNEYNRVAKATKESEAHDEAR